MLLSLVSRWNTITEIYDERESLICLILPPLPNLSSCLHWAGDNDWIGLWFRSEVRCAGQELECPRGVWMGQGEDAGVGVGWRYLECNDVQVIKMEGVARYKSGRQKMLLSPQRHERLRRMNFLHIPEVSHSSGKD